MCCFFEVSSWRANNHLYFNFVPSLPINHTKEEEIRYKSRIFNAKKIYIENTKFHYRATLMYNQILWKKY